MGRMGRMGVESCFCNQISLNRAQDVRRTIILGNPKKKKMLPSSDTVISYLLELFSYLKSSLRLT